jgi:pyruvate,water dikinase
VIGWLDEAPAPERVGGKAAALARLRGLGLPVPDGFCVTVEGFARRGGEGFAGALAAAWERLGTAAAAVRSSAAGEDGARASFAGLHATRLGVTSAAAVAAALDELAASAAAAAGYRARRGLGDPTGMAALVQRLVAAEVAGVAFTRHPLTGEQVTVVEASWGLGEAVVAGLVTPDRFTVSPAGAVVVDAVGGKEVAVVAAADGDGVRRVEVEPARRVRPCLDAAAARAVAGLARACERRLGAPQDVEWALAGGRLYLLQSRPITAVAAPSPLRPAAGRPW